jgi:hypothetical protein
MRRNYNWCSQDNTSLKEELIHEGQKKNMAQQKVDKMENHIQGIFHAISDSEGLQVASLQEKMRKITQTLQQYKE